MYSTVLYILRYIEYCICMYDTSHRGPELCVPKSLSSVTVMTKDIQLWDRLHGFRKF